MGRNRKLTEVLYLVNIEFVRKLNHKKWCDEEVTVRGITVKLSLQFRTAGDTRTDKELSSDLIGRSVFEGIQ